MRKCAPENRAEVRRLFEKEPFGELERLVTTKILDVAQGVAREELRSDAWLQSLAQLSGRSFEQMRVAVLEFLDSDVLQISLESLRFLPRPNDRAAGISILKRSAWKWRSTGDSALAVSGDSNLSRGLSEQPVTLEPGFEQFLKDATLSRDVTEEEIEFLRALRFRGRRPTPLYYYRELQNFRDPLHFAGASTRALRTTPL